MYKEPVTTDAAAATLSAAKCDSCHLCFVCHISPTPDLEIMHLASLWGLS